MHITKQAWKSKNGKTYYTVLLRESFREEGRVKKRTIANLKNCSEKDVAAIEFALRHKDSLDSLISRSSIHTKQGKSFGAVWAVYQIAQRLGIQEALGDTFQGKLALWQVIGRVIDQGSRLSAVRLASAHACEILGFTRGFNEDDLYENLSWVTENQDSIEDRLFQQRARNHTKPPELFLYDVTSSYFEGDKNELAAYGYNRDRKKGKKQVVMGLLCDEEGTPLSAELFKGNTQDPQTFSSQIRKATKRFGCTRATFVGDRGMIKAGQIEILDDAAFHYITAITKPQIETLLKAGTLNLDLFDTEICEVASENVRYIYRKNPWRAEEIAATRQSKCSICQQLITEQNLYLKEHPRAGTATALKKINQKIKTFKIGGWVSATVKDRILELKIDEAQLYQEAVLDGCYVIKTDLPGQMADKQTIHDRYKDLALVENAFRTCKTAHLELRPIYVRTEAHTRAHALIVMLSYMVLRELRQMWKSIDMTVEEGIEQLKTVCTMEVSISGKCFWNIPEPRKEIKNLLECSAVKLPATLPYVNLKVVTKKKLVHKRK
jgi:transposase